MEKNTDLNNADLHDKEQVLRFTTATSIRMNSVWNPAEQNKLTDGK
jgi:hypothetical protein